MIILLPGNEMLNSSHVSLVSGLQPMNDEQGRYGLRILFQGSHEHRLVGTREELAEVRKMIAKALGQVTPG